MKLASHNRVTDPMFTFECPAGEEKVETFPGFSQLESMFFDFANKSNNMF